MKSKLKMLLFVVCAVAATPGLSFAGQGGGIWDAARSAFPGQAAEAWRLVDGAASPAKMANASPVLLADEEVVLVDRGPRRWHRGYGYGYGYGIGAVVLVAVLVTVLVLVLL